MSNRIKIWFALRLSLLLAALLLAACSGGTPLKPITPGQAAVLYNPRGNAVAGNPKGKVTLVEFFDYQCHFCRKMDPVVQQLIKTDPEIRIVYKEYILFGPNSKIAAQAALAAQQQDGYLALREAMMTAAKPLNIEEIIALAKSVHLNTEKLADAMTNPQINQQIDENNGLAAQLGVNGAPVFIVANSAIATPPNDVNTKQLLWVGSASLKQLQNLVAQVQ